MTMLAIAILLAIGFAYVKRWYDYNYTMVDVEVEYWVTNNEEDYKTWLNEWKPYLQRCDYVDGCGCCNAIYEIRGSRRAIEDFPLADYAEIEWSPEAKHRQFRYSAIRSP